MYDSKHTFPEADFVTVVSGEDISGIDFSLDPGGLLRVRFFNEETGEEVRHAQVHFIHAGTQGAVSAGNERWLAAGQYLLNTDLSSIPGQYVSEWFEDAYDVETATAVEVITGEITEIEMILSPSGQISGVVYDADGETPLAGVSLYAFPVEGDFPGAGANTDENGRYTIEGLASGSYRVAASLTEYKTLYFGGVSDEAEAALVVVNAPDQTSEIDFLLIPE